MKRYFAIFLLLLVAETVIALFHFHKFVRGFLGDVLVIPLLYTFFRAVTSIKPKTLLFGVLGFALAVECIQLLPLSQWYGSSNNIFGILLGTTFDAWDLLAYLFGIIPVLFIEKIKNNGTP